MSYFAKQRVLHVWIAMLAMLFGALLPALAPAASQALAPRTAGFPPMELCTMNGPKVLVADGADTGQPAHGAIDHLLKHCSSCVTHGHGAALPPAEPFAFAVSATRERHPALFYRAARPLFPWTAAQPRAPPAVA